MQYYHFAKKLLFNMNPELAHNLALMAMSFNLLPNQKILEYDNLRVNLWDREFTNPIGLAAGFDKNATAISFLAKQGFGFLELGTVTPKPQYGNPKPRLFRLQEDEAIINRLGFNNGGSIKFTSNLRRYYGKLPVIIGANIGKNKNSANANEDYLALLHLVYEYADYITVNISSPNTPGLRNLQNKELLDDLMADLIRVRDGLATSFGRKIPLLVKIAPDLDHKEREEIASIMLFRRVDGMIISNTTITRPDLKSYLASESGGLSGRPLLEPSNNVLADMYQLTGGQIPIIGVGGIFSGDDAYAKIKAGASLVQIYSSIIYRGFEIINQIKSRLDYLLKLDGFNNIQEAVGKDVL